MILTQHYLECMSHASYLLGDETTGRAVVVDPRRDIDVYVEEAEALGLTIERVIETHVHADFVGGHLELAARTGAVISYGEGADVDFRIEPLHDGRRLSLGDVTLEVLATPGHTPESICVVVYEHFADERPYGVLTGDTLFVGGVGRPDLVAAAGGESTAEGLARQLYRSLHDKLLRLPDETRVFPAHGAGSSCGKQIGAARSSTLGIERRSNDALRPMSEEAFVADVTRGQPFQPLYFRHAAQRNRELRSPAAGAALPMLDLDAVLSRRADGASLLDTRAADAFARRHVKCAVGVGLVGRFAERVGSVIVPDRDIVLVGEPTAADEAVLRLRRIGYDRVIGQLDVPPTACTARAGVFEASRRLTVEQLDELLSSDRAVQLVDVRDRTETASGMLPGARAIPLAALVGSLATLDRTTPVVVYCGSGQRSLTAASVLVAHGFDDVADLVGGWAAYSGDGARSVHCRSVHAR